MEDPNPQILRANLSALSRTEPDLARRLESTPSAELAWSIARNGSPTATWSVGGVAVTLASRFNPDAEAAQMVRQVDPVSHGCVVVMGFGLGYQVREALKKYKKPPLTIVFEPHLPLLRAVLEHVDHSDWLGKPSVVMAHDPADMGPLLGRIEPRAGLLSIGTQLVTHPAARRYAGQEIQRFGQTVADITAYCRTVIATTLVNASRTVSNLARNAGHYAAGETIAPLEGAAAGRPAVCVSAGPSLARNVDLLRNPELRQNVVVITAQTTLKPLLDRGIRPDFVTALDYHEISRRFYEDLPDLPDVTLVAEAKVNPAVLDAFPGPVRMIRAESLDRMLPRELVRSIPALPQGGTVAHLSFYLAQLLGCDPIILIGQDLGFSDGLYYCPGTAAHDVWSVELGPFNTLEMMEWKRVARHRSHLRKLEDVHGKTIYSDEQMITYLRQFERDFAAASQRVIDATEGGLPKRGAQNMTLAEALKRFADQPLPPLPAAERTLDPDRLTGARDRLKRVVEEIEELSRLSHRTVPLLKKMIDSHRDDRRMNKLFKQLEPIQMRVSQLKLGFAAVSQLNSVGTFRRSRADRALEYADGDAREKQRLRIERDLDNVTWIVEGCEEALKLFRAGHERTARLCQHAQQREAVSP